MCVFMCIFWFGVLFCSYFGGRRPVIHTHWFFSFRCFRFFANSAPITFILKFVRFLWCHYDVVVVAVVCLFAFFLHFHHLIAKCIVLHWISHNNTHIHTYRDRHTFYIHIWNRFYLASNAYFVVSVVLVTIQKRQKCFLFFK